MPRRARPPWCAPTHRCAGRSPASPPAGWRLRGWERLGYARLSDHARERLGLAARQVQELARIEAALAALPRIDAAFSSGVLPWTRTRLLCRVATPVREPAAPSGERQTGALPTDPEPRLRDFFELPQPCRFFFAASRDAARLIRATICSVRRDLELRAGLSCSEDEAVGAMLDHARCRAAATRATSLSIA